jgi:eukaryotic-like serine/threonine-protein kinase
MATPPSSTPRSEPPDIVGQMAGEYRLRKKLGEGGYGAVYEAEHPLLKRRAAVKVLHRAAGTDPEGVRRFISEAQAANQIHSRHILDIFSFGTMPDGRHFYVMDLLDGEPLDRYMDRESRVDVAGTVQLLSPIAEALDAAHAAGIVHRDLKPQNIFLVWEKNGETIPKLLDFGMAKLLGQSSVQTVSGTVVGTPLYMSPEQALGQKVDGRADVYALGLLCHELLTGQPPMTGATAIAVLAAHLTQKAPPVSEVCPDLAPALDAPILRMLEKDAQARQATAGEAIAELRRAAERAGHVIAPGMPHLPEPPALSQREGSEQASPDPPNAPWAEDGRSERGLERDTLGRSTEVASRRGGVGWLLVGLLALGGGAMYFVTSAKTDSIRPGASAPTMLSTGAPAPPLVVSSDVPGSASATPSEPPSVEVTVQGAPRGARILRDGKSLGEAPGPVAVPFGDETVMLTVTAAGHESTNLFVVPNHASSATVMLKKRAPGPATTRDGIPRDLENPF